MLLQSSLQNRIGVYYTMFAYSWHDLTVTQLTMYIHSGFALCAPSATLTSQCQIASASATCKIGWHLGPHSECTVHREAFDLHRVEVEEWHCQFLLDDALNQASQSAAPSLQAACTILPGAAAFCLRYGMFFLGCCTFCAETLSRKLTRASAVQKH